MTFPKDSPPQAVLFASAYGRHPVLAHEGEAVAFDIESIGPDMGDLAPDLKLPTDSGFYVWEGVVRNTRHGDTFDGPVEPDCEWVGTVRPAALHDIVGFCFSRRC